MLIGIVSNACLSCLDQVVLLEELKFFEFPVEEVLLLILVRAIFKIQLDCHVEGKHKLVVLEQTSADIAVKDSEEVLFQLADSSLNIFDLLGHSKALNEELSEPFH